MCTTDYDFKAFLEKSAQTIHKTKPDQKLVLGVQKKYFGATQSDKNLNFES